MRHLVRGVGRAVRDAIHAIARPMHGRIPAGIAVDPERTPGGREVRVHEEVAKAGIAQVLLDSPADAGARGRSPRLPRPPRPIGAFRQPDTLRRPAEEAAVLGPTDRELEPDALVAGEQREESMGRGGGDDLEPARPTRARGGPRRCRRRSRERAGAGGRGARARSPPAGGGALHRWRRARRAPRRRRAGAGRRTPPSRRRRRDSRAGWPAPA